MRPVCWVRFVYESHPAVILSNRVRMQVNPGVTVIPGQTAENLPLVAQLVLDEQDGMPHRTHFAIDEVVTVGRDRIGPEITVLDRAREVELVELLTMAWALHRPGGFPTTW